MLFFWVNIQSFVPKRVAKPVHTSEQCVCVFVQVVYLGAKLFWIAWDPLRGISGCMKLTKDLFLRRRLLAAQFLHLCESPAVCVCARERGRGGGIVSLYGRVCKIFVTIFKTSALMSLE